MKRASDRGKKTKEKQVEEEGKKREREQGKL